MEYSFEVCYHFGKVYFSNEKKGCALIVLPDKKKTTLRSILIDLKLIISCIKKLQPNDRMNYLWFIGVDPSEQNKGIGSVLLSEIIDESNSDKRTICLETSTIKNLPWYQKFGFNIYNELDLGYKLFFLKKDADK